MEDTTQLHIVGEICEPVRGLNLVVFHFPPSIKFLEGHIDDNDVERIIVNIGYNITLIFEYQIFSRTKFGVFKQCTKCPAGTHHRWAFVSVWYSDDCHYLHNFIQWRRHWEDPGLYINILPADFKKLLDNFILSHAVHHIE